MAPKSGFRQVIQSVAQYFIEPAANLAMSPAAEPNRLPNDLAVLPTGFRPLDKALGIGGLPQGRITELVGSTAALANGGATGVAARIAARVQRRQEIVTIIDLSRSFDPWQAERCGLVAPQLLLSRPETIFAALSTLENAARTVQLGLVVLGPVADILGHIEPELLLTLLRRLQNIVHASNSVFIFLTLAPQEDPFNNAAIYPAGFPLAEIATIRLWLQDEGWTYKDGLAVAYKANVTVIKNELALPGRGANLRIKLER